MSEGAGNWWCMGCIAMLLAFLGRHPRFLVTRSPSLDLSPRHSSSPMVSHNTKFELTTALAYLDSGKIKVNGIVNKTFTIDQWDECLEAMRNKSAIKALSWCDRANCRLQLYGSKGFQRCVFSLSVELLSGLHRRNGSHEPHIYRIDSAAVAVGLGAYISLFISFVPEKSGHFYLLGDLIFGSQHSRLGFIGDEFI